MISYIDFFLRREEITTLWRECFGDTREYTDFFIDNCPDKDCIACIEENKIVSFMFLLNGSKDGFRVKYVYAACTEQQYRRKGIMTSLLSFAVENERKRGTDALFLLPAGNSLVTFYKKAGFEISSCLYKELLNPESCSCSGKTAETCDVKKVSSVREKVLNITDSFSFSPGNTVYAVTEYLDFRGRVLLADNGSNVCPVFFTLKDGNAVIDECPDSAVLREAAEYIRSSCKIKNVYFWEQIVYNDTLSSNDYTKCGMYCPLSVSFEKFIHGAGAERSGLFLD